MRSSSAELGDNPSDETLLNTRLIPDPRKVRLRVYQTNSTHKSMSAIRQGSMLLVKDVDFHTVEAQFQRGGVHPRLDQPEPAADREPRRRAPADGAGGLRPGRNAIEIALDDPPGGQQPSADLEIFPRPRRRRDGAGASTAQSGFTDYLAPGANWADVAAQPCRRTSSASIRPA